MDSLTLHLMSVVSALQATGSPTLNGSVGPWLQPQLLS